MYIIFLQSSKCFNSLQNQQLTCLFVVYIPRRFSFLLSSCTNFFKYVRDRHLDGFCVRTCLTAKSWVGASMCSTPKATGTWMVPYKKGWDNNINSIGYNFICEYVAEQKVEHELTQYFYRLNLIRGEYLTPIKDWSRLMRLSECCCLVEIVMAPMQRQCLHWQRHLLWGPWQHPSMLLLSSWLNHLISFTIQKFNQTKW